MPTLKDPDLSLFLYVTVVVLGFMLSPRFGKVMAALQGEGAAIAAKAGAAGTAATSTATGTATGAATGGNSGGQTRV